MSVSGGSSGGVTSITAADGSIVIGGTPTAPTIATGALNAIASAHPPTANWSNNNQQITVVGGPTAATAAARSVDTGISTPTNLTLASGYTDPGGPHPPWVSRIGGVAGVTPYYTMGGQITSLAWANGVTIATVPITAAHPAVPDYWSTVSQAPVELVLQMDASGNISVFVTSTGLALPNGDVISLNGWLWRP